MLYAFPDGDYSNIDIMDQNSKFMYDWFNDKIKTYMKVTKVCPNKAGCWNSGTGN